MTSVALDKKDYPELARVSARFISEADPDDKRSPEAWFRFTSACREILRDWGPESFAYESLCLIVCDISAQFPDSEWTLKSFELLAEEVAWPSPKRDRQR